MKTTEEIALTVFRESGFSPLEPPSDGAEELADGVQRGLVYEQPRSVAEWKVCTIAGRRRIVLRSGLIPTRANWAAAAGLVVFLHESDPWFRSLDPAKRAEVVRDAASWIVAPPEAFRAALAETGPNPRALGARFQVTETCATMRIAEVGGPSSAVVKPDGGVHKRGRQLSWLDDDCLRALARRPGLKSARRRQLTDEPGRVALLARSS